MSKSNYREKQRIHDLETKLAEANRQLAIGQAERVRDRKQLAQQGANLRNATRELDELNRLVAERTGGARVRVHRDFDRYPGRMMAVQVAFDMDRILYSMMNHDGLTNVSYEADRIGYDIGRQVVHAIMQEARK